jgi:catalase (peroxidase I)
MTDDNKSPYDGAGKCRRSIRDVAEPVELAFYTSTPCPTQAGSTTPVSSGALTCAKRTWQALMTAKTGGHGLRHYAPLFIRMAWHSAHALHRDGRGGAGPSSASALNSRRIM